METHLQVEATGAVYYVINCFHKGSLDVDGHRYLVVFVEIDRSEASHHILEGSNDPPDVQFSKCLESSLKKGQQCKFIYLL